MAAFVLPKINIILRARLIIRDEHF
jgi:putative SOS response-associated peptidase YedK